MADFSRWNGMNGGTIAGWAPSSLADTLVIGEGGAMIGFGITATSVYLAGPTGGNGFDGPTPLEIAQQWTFGQFPGSWPTPNPWKSQGWGRSGAVSGAPAGAIVSSWPIWYRWEKGNTSEPPPPPPPPPPDPTPVLGGSDPTWGQTIPQSFGVRRVDGAPIWVGAVSRIADHGFVATVDFAVAFGTTARPSPIDRLVFLERLWADNASIYDASSGTPVVQQGMSVTFYPGLPDQQPDPTIRAAMGEATPAFRDMFYAVIKGFPLQTHDTRLPHIRAELHDAPAFTAPQQTAFTLLDPPTEVNGDFMVTDFDSGTAYAISNPNSQPHILHSYDVGTGTEVSAILMDGALVNNDVRIEPPNQYDHLATDWWTVYDKDNLIFHGQHCQAESNGMRIGTWRIDTGALMASFGNQSNDTVSSPSNIAFSKWADLLKYRAFGGSFHALIVGDNFHRASVMTYRKQVAVVSPLNQARLDYVGVIGPTDNFTLANDFTHDFTSDVPVYSVLAYPVLERPELIAAFKTNTLDRQDCCALVGAGTRLYVFAGGLVGRPSNEQDVVSPAGFQVTDDMRVVFDGFDGLNPRALWVDPNTGCIMCHASDDAGTTGRLYRFQPTFVETPNGAMLATLEMLYSKTMNNVDSRLLAQSIKNNNMSAGTFAYQDGDLVVRSLSTGEEVYRHDADTPLSNNFSYDSTNQHIVDLSSGGSPAVPQLLGLRGTISELVPVNDFLTWSAKKLGYADGEITVDGGITDSIIGGNVTTPTPARQAMTTACAMFGIYSVEVGGQVSFVRPAQGSNATVQAVLSKDDLSQQQEGQMSSVMTTSLSSSELPSDIRVTYLDPANDYNLQSQTYRRVRFPFQTAKTSNVASYTAPLVMSSLQAFNVAGRLALSAYGEATTYDYRLPFRFVALTPADVIGFLNDDNVTVGALSQITQVQYNGDWSMTVKGVRWSLSDVLSLSVDSALGTQNSNGIGPSDSIALACDTSLIEPTDISPGAATIYTGAGSLGQSWWRSARVDRTLDSVTSQLYLSTTPIAWGVVNEALPPTEIPMTTFATDHDTVLTVTGRGMTASMLTSVTAEQCRAGANAALIGKSGTYELVYFQTVERVSDKVVKLSGLLRGRRGTNVNCDAHVSGETFILVTSNGVRALLRGDRIDLKHRDKLLTYYATGERTSRPAPATVMTFEGNSEKPWTPRRLRASFAASVNVVNATDYTNECGQGDRRSLVSVIGYYNDSTGEPVNNNIAADDSPLNLVDGRTGSGLDQSTGMQTGQTDAVIVFDFSASGFKQIINEFTWVQSNGTSIGTYSFDGSDDQISWTTLASGLDLPASGGVHAFSNSTGFKYYRLIQTGGTTSDSPRLKEITFKSKAVIVDANDILITWLRRDRMSPADLWVTDVQPMTEAQELYQVEIFPADPTTDGTWPKALPLVTLPRIVYSAAQQTSDGQTPPLVQLGVRATQLGTGGPDDVTKRLGYQSPYTVLDVE